MAEEIQLCKADGQGWGFRVTGGADFGTPLTIIKINKGSVGERAGLRVGDMIIQVNDQKLGHMTHFQATDIITKAGNMFTAIVIRGSLVQAPQLLLQNVQENTEIATQDSQEVQPQTVPEDLVLPSLLTNLINSGLEEQHLDQEVADSVESQMNHNQLDAADKEQGLGWEIVEERSVPVVISEQSEKKTGQTSGQAVNSKKRVATETIKKALQQSGESREDSKVAEQEMGEPRVQQGNEGEGEESKVNHIEYTDEEIAEMMSGCAEVLVGTCIGVDFQKLPPDTDIMKSEVLHLLIDEKIRQPEKKLTTFQQRPARPKPKPKGEPQTPPVPYYPLKYKGQPKKEEVPNQEADPTEEGSVGNTCPDDSGPTEVAMEGGEGEHVEELGENNGEQTDQEPGAQTEHEEVPENETLIEPDVPGQTIENPNDIESQLSEIQNQLAAIIQLPVEIQQHLSFIQQQLSKILELRAAESIENQEPQEEGTMEENEPLEETEIVDEEQVEEEEPLPEEDPVENGEVEEQVVEDLEPESEPEPEPPKQKKDIQWKKEEAEKRKPFFPLTPQPRPVQLPGGRKWFQPRDVYTEDFIAETISGKEEVITGTTIGVDFRKFECNYDHLKSSSVYKMIHSHENKRMPGTFAGRAEKTRAKEDYITTEEPTEVNFSFYKTRHIIN